MRVELPLVDPIYKTFHFQGMGCAIIAENPTIRNWYLNEVMDLFCQGMFLGGRTSPELNIDRSEWFFNPYIEKTEDVYSNQLHENIHAIIRRWIDQGYYVCFADVDDYYMKGKTWYREKHFPHDGMIYGYDTEKKIYLVHAYDCNWVYNTFTVPTVCFGNGVRWMEKQGGCSTLRGIRPKVEHVEFNAERVIQNIREYLNSSMERYPPDVRGVMKGTVVMDYIGMYLDMLHRGEIPYERMDRRVMRVIWEQKKVMLERIQKLEDELMLGHQISKEFEAIVREADALRLLYAAHHRKRHDSLLPGMKQRLLRLKERECELLNALIFEAERTSEGINLSFGKSDK